MNSVLIPGPPGRRSLAAADSTAGIAATRSVQRLVEAASCVLRCRRGCRCPSLLGVCDHRAHPHSAAQALPLKWTLDAKEFEDCVRQPSTLKSGET